MPSWCQVTSLIEVISDLTVRPSEGSQSQDRVNQRLLVSTHRTKVESDRTDADDKGICGGCGGSLRGRYYRDYSTVTE